MNHSSPLPRVQASTVLFDLDGTIIDSIGHFWDVTKATFRRVGLEEPKRANVCAAMRAGGNPFETLLPEDIENREALVAQCQEIVQSIWRARHPIYIDLIPGADVAVKALAERGIRLGIATASFGSWVEDLLRAHGIWSHFECVVTGLEVGHRKPAPDLLLEALRRLGEAPEHAVYVGDSPLDLAAARAAGMAGIGVLSGISRREDLLPESPHAIVESIADVAAVVS